MQTQVQSFALQFPTQSWGTGEVYSTFLAWLLINTQQGLLLLLLLFYYIINNFTDSQAIIHPDCHLKEDPFDYEFNVSSQVA